MNNKKILIILILIFVLLLGGASVLYAQLGQQFSPDQLSAQTPQAPGPADETEPPKHPAPDITVFDASGNQVLLSNYFGKPIVLNFWASWCGPCQMEMPDFHEKYLEIGDDVQFLMINMTDGSRETVDTALTFIGKAGYTFPVLFDTTAQAAMIYQAYSLPTTYFIDAEGNLIARATGAISADTLQKGIDMIS